MLPVTVLGMLRMTVLAREAITVRSAKESQFILSSARYATVSAVIPVKSVKVLAGILVNIVREMENINRRLL